MRTTVDLDDDVLQAVKERARRERRSAGAVLSELARAALTGRLPAGETALPVGETAELHGFRPLPNRGPAVSTALVDQLLDEDGG